MIKNIVLFFISLIITNCAPKPVEWTENGNVSASLSMTYIQQGDLTKARLMLNQALREQPRAPPVWSTLAYLEEISGNMTTAIRDYQYAVRLNPDRGDVHNNYGAFLCRHGEPQAGMQELLKAVQIPSYIYRADAYENAGRCALILGDRVAAQGYFATALRNGGHR